MDSMKLSRICESFRDWGRDCYCEPGKDTCMKRFEAAKDSSRIRS